MVGAFAGFVAYTIMRLSCDPDMRPFLPAFRPFSEESSAAGFAAL